MTSDNATAGDAPHQPRWQPVKAIDRRVLGVLVEKAKTTPDAYPLSLNALVTGCNQKSNRHPLSQYEPEDIEESLERLRMMGAVAAVQGGGRVGKFRHYMYEWLGVDKVELSIMTELLLRGAQTEGDFRSRAARMDTIPDLATMRTLLDSLKSKGLVQALTPEGRGQIVTHTLYLPEELEKLRRQHGEHADPRFAGGARSVGSALPRPSARCRQQCRASSRRAGASQRRRNHGPASRTGRACARRSRSFARTWPTWSVNRKRMPTESISFGNRWGDVRCREPARSDAGLPVCVT